MSDMSEQELTICATLQRAIGGKSHDAIGNAAVPVRSLSGFGCASREVAGHDQLGLTYTARCTNAEMLSLVETAII